MRETIQIKWAAPNTPYIKIHSSSQQLMLTKVALKELQQEIAEFMDFYKDSFNNENIGHEDEPVYNNE